MKRTRIILGALVTMITIASPNAQDTNVPDSLSITEALESLQSQSAGGIYYAHQWTDSLYVTTGFQQSTLEESLMYFSTVQHWHIL